MTKQEVIAILGEPKLTSFDMYGDKWEYDKYNYLFGQTHKLCLPCTGEPYCAKYYFSVGAPK